MARLLRVRGPRSLAWTGILQKATKTQRKREREGLIIVSIDQLPGSGGGGVLGLQKRTSGPGTGLRRSHTIALSRSLCRFYGVL